MPTSENKTLITDFMPSLLIIIGLFIILYIIQLGVMPLISQDETRYAEIAREMIASGNWVVPTFDGIHYFEKPVLGHWMNAASELIFGYNNFAVRFSSAFCTGLTALFLFFFLRKFAKNNNIALIAPLIFLTFGLTLGIGTFSVLDAQTTFFITAIMVTFFAAYKSEKVINCAIWLILCGIFCGLGFLVKGFVVWAVVAVSILPFLIWEKSWIRIFTMPWIPMIAGILVILPWGIKINEQAPDFWNYFIMVENFNRFTQATAASGALHPQPFWFFLPILVAGTLPWFLHVVETFTGLKDKTIFSNSLIRYSATWIVLPFIFFSISSGKLATYILPCFVPLSVITTIGIFNYFDKRKEAKLFNIINSVFAYTLSLAIVLVIIYSIVACFAKVPILWNMKQLPVGIIAIAFWIALLLYCRKAKTPLKKLVILAIAPLFAMGFKSFLAPDFALANNSFGSFIRDQSKYVSDSSKIAAYQDMVGATCWYLKRDDIYIYGKPGEFEYPLSQDTYKNRYISKEMAASFIEKNKVNKVDTVIFTRSKDLNTLPVKPDLVISSDKRLFAKFN